MEVDYCSDIAARRAKERQLNLLPVTPREHQGRVGLSRRRSRVGENSVDNTIAREDSRPRFFVEARERLDRMYTEILRLGLERHVVELELYG